MQKYNVMQYGNVKCNNTFCLHLLEWYERAYITKLSSNDSMLINFTMNNLQSKNDINIHNCIDDMLHLIGVTLEIYD